MENTHNITCEILDVKISARVRKRGFTPWKAWRKQMCGIHRVENGLELWIHPAHVVPSDNSVPMQVILIPKTAVCYRTDSRTKPFSFGIFLDAKSRKALCYLAGVSESNSQKWIFSIRHELHGNDISLDPHCISISIIDNAHSRAANMFGIYGNLTAENLGICINNYHSEKHSIVINWSHILHSHFASNTGTEDDNKISIIHTTSDFINGEGQLVLFSLQASKLLNLLLLQYQSHAILRGVSEQLTENHHVNQNRRLSRSEGDLCVCCESDRDSGWSSCSPVEYNPIFLPNGDEDFNTCAVTDDFGYIIRRKTSSNLQSDDLFNSVKECDKIHGFDQVINLFGSLPDFPGVVNTRRTSGMSVASGIYEEIIEGPSINCDGSSLTAVYEEPLYMPPPLPPRGRYTSLTSASDEGVDECDDCSCSTPTTAQYGHSCVLFHARSEMFPLYDSSNIDLFSTHPKRKLSETSTHSDSACIDTYESKGNRFGRRCFSNSAALKKTVTDNIPRCNTAPEQNLKESQLSKEQITSITKKSRSSSLHNSENSARSHEKESTKSKSRFDLTPIRNKLNSFIKGNSENETPKTGKFYSLPRSFNNKKFTINPEKKTSKSKRKMYLNNAAKSCDILNTNAEPEMADINAKISQSAEIIDDQYMDMTPKIHAFKTLPKIKNKYFSDQKIAFDSEYKVETQILSESSELYFKSPTTIPHQKQIIEILVNDNKILNCNSCQIYENIFESNNEEIFVENVIPAQTVVTTEPRFSLMRLEWSRNKTATELVHNGDYVPMSPGVGLLPQEDQYMEMTGLQKVNEEEPHYMTMSGSVKS